MFHISHFKNQIYDIGILRINIFFSWKPCLGHPFVPEITSIMCHTRKCFRGTPKLKHEPVFWGNFNRRIFWSCSFYTLLVQICVTRRNCHCYNNLAIFFETMPSVINCCLVLNVIINNVPECIIFRNSSIAFSQITDDTSPKLIYWLNRFKIDAWLKSFGADASPSIKLGANTGFGYLSNTLWFDYVASVQSFLGCSLPSSAIKVFFPATQRYSNFSDLRLISKWLLHRFPWPS